MNYNPVIIIPGIGQSKVILADNKGNKIKNAWPVELDTKSLLDELKGSVMKMMLFRKDAGFSDKIAAVAHDVCAPLALNRDGTKKHNAIAVSYNRSVAELSKDDRRFIYRMVPMEELGKKIGENKLFCFAYDPFGDAYETASKLNDFVISVKEQTSCKKVDFICISLGGVVLRAYLDMFGEKNDAEKIVNVVSALDGTSAVADVFENRLNLDNPAQLLNAIGGKAASLSSMVGMLPEEVIKNTIDKSVAELKNSLIFNCTMMWGSIPVSRFDTILRMHPSIDSTLREKVTRLYEFSRKLDENVRALEEKGMRFYQICGYGQGIFPVCQSKSVQSDMLVDVSSATLGARCQNISSKPDTSTCTFPERTWFFNRMIHNDTAYNDVALSLVKDILTGEVDKVCEKYPQFNGSRNIRKLKYDLVPKAKKAVSEGRNAAALANAIEDYEKLLAETIINGDNNVKELERRIESLLEGTC